MGREWVGRPTKSRLASVWVDALGRLFCPRRPKRTRADEMGRRIGVALTTKSWETSGRRHVPPMMPRLQKCHHMDGYFSARENKEERYKLTFDAQKERMKWDRKRAKKKLEIKREKIELEKQQAAIKWELKKAKTFGDIELEKEMLQLARDADSARVMLADETLLDEHAKKLFADKKKEINDLRE